MDFTASVFTKISDYQLYVKIQLESFAMWKVWAGIHWFSWVDFMKHTLTQLFVKNSNTEFHVNLTNDLVADTWHKQTDGRTDGMLKGRDPHIRGSFSLTS